MLVNIPLVQNCLHCLQPLPLNPVNPLQKPPQLPPLPLMHPEQDSVMENQTDSICIPVIPPNTTSVLVATRMWKTVVPGQSLMTAVSAVLGPINANVRSNDTDSMTNNLRTVKQERQHLRNYTNESNQRRLKMIMLYFALCKRPPFQ